MRIMETYNNLMSMEWFTLCGTILSGLISCNGEDGTSNVGGASGGSIKLTTVTLNGKGIIKSNGGKGIP